MTVPGVGPITSLAFRATVDDPERFATSKSVGSYFGMTPRVYQSGEVDCFAINAVWRCAMIRTPVENASFGATPDT